MELSWPSVLLVPFSFFLHFCCIDLWGLANTGLPGLANSIQEAENSSSGGSLSYANHPGQQPTPHATSKGSHAQDHHPLALITPEPGTRQLGTAPMSQSPRNHSNQPNLDLPRGSHRLLPGETTIEALVPAVPSSPSWTTRCFSVGYLWMPLLQGTVTSNVSFLINHLGLLAYVVVILSFPFQHHLFSLFPAFFPIDHLLSPRGHLTPLLAYHTSCFVSSQCLPSYWQRASETLHASFKPLYSLSRMLKEIYTRGRLFFPSRTFCHYLTFSF